ncbi:SAM-dependent methyltransferase [Ensifer sp. ENS02]|uniref:class I SAM-dependent methyltransferase n=1 Tax=Ensifer sp. ENS02 TaxID=2769290 RepID=UPI001AEDDC7C|nr:SAM-dependent methyltransferase [Ensifer sp. ENS02]
MKVLTEEERLRHAMVSLPDQERGARPPSSHGAQDPLTPLSHEKLLDVRNAATAVPSITAETTAFHLADDAVDVALDESRVENPGISRIDLSLNGADSAEKASLANGHGRPDNHATATSTIAVTLDGPGNDIDVAAAVRPGDTDTSAAGGSHGSDGLVPRGGNRAATPGISGIDVSRLGIHHEDKGGPGNRDGRPDGHATATSIIAATLDGPGNDIVVAAAASSDDADTPMAAGSHGSDGLELMSGNRWASEATRSMSGQMTGGSWRISGNLFDIDQDATGIALSGDGATRTVSAEPSRMDGLNSAHSHEEGAPGSSGLVIGKAAADPEPANWLTEGDSPASPGNEPYFRIEEATLVQTSGLDDAPPVGDDTAAQMSSTNVDSDQRLPLTALSTKAIEKLVDEFDRGDSILRKARASLFSGIKTRDDIPSEFWDEINASEKRSLQLIETTCTKFGFADPSADLKAAFGNILKWADTPPASSYSVSSKYQALLKAAIDDIDVYRRGRTQAENGFREMLERGTASSRNETASAPGVRMALSGAGRRAIEDALGMLETVRSTLDNNRRFLSAELSAAEDREGRTTVNDIEMVQREVRLVSVAALERLRQASRKSGVPDFSSEFDHSYQDVIRSLEMLKTEFAEGGWYAASKMEAAINAINGHLDQIAGITERYSVLHGSPVQNDDNHNMSAQYHPSDGPSPPEKRSQVPPAFISPDKVAEPDRGNEPPSATVFEPSLTEALSGEPETRPATNVDQLNSALYEGTISERDYRGLLQATIEEIKIDYGDEIGVMFVHCVDSLIRRVGILGQDEHPVRYGSPDRLERQERRTDNHDKAVRAVINHAVMLARAFGADTATADVQGNVGETLELALALVHELRAHSLENSQSLIFRDADHYLSQRCLEWQPLWVEKWFGPGATLPFAALGSKLAEIFYDRRKSGQLRREAAGEVVRKPIEKTSMPAAAPGGRDWSRLGITHFREGPGLAEPDSLNDLIVRETPERPRDGLAPGKDQIVGRDATEAHSNVSVEGATDQPQPKPVLSKMPAEAEPSPQVQGTLTTTATTEQNMSGLFEATLAAKENGEDTAINVNNGDQTEAAGADARTDSAIYGNVLANDAFIDRLESAHGVSGLRVMYSGALAMFADASGAQVNIVVDSKDGAKITRMARSFGGYAGTYASLTRAAVEWAAVVHGASPAAHVFSPSGIPRVPDPQDVRLIKGAAEALYYAFPEFVTADNVQSLISKAQIVPPDQLPAGVLGMVTPPSGALHAKNIIFSEEVFSLDPADAGLCLRHEFLHALQADAFLEIYSDELAPESPDTFNEGMTNALALFASPSDAPPMSGAMKKGIEENLFGKQSPFLPYAIATVMAENVMSIATIDHAIPAYFSANPAGVEAINAARLHLESAIDWEKYPTYYHHILFEELGAPKIKLNGWPPVFPGQEPRQLSPLAGLLKADEAPSADQSPIIQRPQNENNAEGSSSKAGTLLPSDAAHAALRTRESVSAVDGDGTTGSRVSRLADDGPSAQPGLARARHSAEVVGTWQTAGKRARDEVASAAKRTHGPDGKPLVPQEIRDRLDPQFVDRLVELVRTSGGSITFRDFMNYSLYGIKDYGGGYYNSGTVSIGRKEPGTIAADFRTAPETSKYFGHAVANAIAEVYRSMGRPSRFDVVEMGAGNGTLAATIIERLSEAHPELHDALNYIIVERSEALIDRQKARLEGARVQWLHASAYELPLQHISGVFLSNELPDAFPVHQVVVREGALKEIHVGLNERNEFVEIEGDLGLVVARNLHIVDQLVRDWSSLPDGQRLTINLEAVDWIRKVGRALKAGGVITVDYGVPGAVLKPPYTVFRKTTPIELAYLAPGAIDITSFVDLLSLLDVGREVGLEPSSIPRLRSFSPQHQFLTENGFQDLARGTTDPRELEAAQELLDRFEAFHVLVQMKGFEPPPNDQDIADARNDKIGHSKRSGDEGPPGAVMNGNQRKPGASQQSGAGEGESDRRGEGEDARVSGLELMPTRPSSNRLPPVVFYSDATGIGLRVPDDPIAHVRINCGFDSEGDPIIADGIVEVTHVYRGDLPPGSGAQLLARLLRAYNVQPTKGIGRAIANENTLEIHQGGGSPEESALGRSAIRALAMLGLEPGTFQFERGRGGGLDLVIDVRAGLGATAPLVSTDPAAKSLGKKGSTKNGVVDLTSSRSGDPIEVRVTEHDRTDDEDPPADGVGAGRPEPDPLPLPGPSERLPQGQDDVPAVEPGSGAQPSAQGRALAEIEEDLGALDEAIRHGDYRAFGDCLQRLASGHHGKPELSGPAGDDVRTFAELADRTLLSGGPPGNADAAQRAEYLSLSVTPLRDAARRLQAGKPVDPAAEPDPFETDHSQNTAISPLLPRDVAVYNAQIAKVVMANLASKLTASAGQFQPVIYPYRGRKVPGFEDQRKREHPRPVEARPQPKDRTEIARDQKALDAKQQAIDEAYFHTLGDATLWLSTLDLSFRQIEGGAEAANAVSNMIKGIRALPRDVAGSRRAATHYWKLVEGAQALPAQLGAFIERLSGGTVGRAEPTYAEVVAEADLAMRWAITRIDRLAGGPIDRGNRLRNAERFLQALETEMDVATKGLEAIEATVAVVPANGLAAKDVRLVRDMTADLRGLLGPIFAREEPDRDLILMAQLLLMRLARNVRDLRWDLSFRSTEDLQNLPPEVRLYHSTRKALRERKSPIEDFERVNVSQRDTEHTDSAGAREMVGPSLVEQVAYALQAIIRDVGVRHIPELTLGATDMATVIGNLETLVNRASSLLNDKMPREYKEQLVFDMLETIADVSGRLQIIVLAMEEKFATTDGEQKRGYNEHIQSALDAFANAQSTLAALAGCEQLPAFATVASGAATKAIQNVEEAADALRLYALETLEVSLDGIDSGTSTVGAFHRVIPSLSPEQMLVHSSRGLPDQAANVRISPVTISSTRARSSQLSLPMLEIVRAEGDRRISASADYPRLRAAFDKPTSVGRLSHLEMFGRRRPRQDIGPPGFAPSIKPSPQIARFHQRDGGKAITETGGGKSTWSVAKPALYERSGLRRRVPVGYETEYQNEGTFWTSRIPQLEAFVQIEIVGAVDGASSEICDSIVVSHLFRGGLPSGSGAWLLGDLIRRSGFLPQRALIVRNIREENTLLSYARKADPAYSLFGRLAANVARSLDLDPVSFTFLKRGEEIDLVVDLRPMAAA